MYKRRARYNDSLWGFNFRHPIGTDTGNLLRSILYRASSPGHTWSPIRCRSFQRMKRLSRTHIYIRDIVSHRKTSCNPRSKLQIIPDINLQKSRTTDITLATSESMIVGQKSTSFVSSQLLIINCLWVDLLFAAANIWFSLFARYANIRRIVWTLLVQFGKGPLKVLYRDLLLFRVCLHCFSMQEAASAINLTYFWDSWRFKIFNNGFRLKPSSPRGQKMVFWYSPE